MRLPTGLILRPEFRPQHDKGKESPAGTKAAPAKTSETGTTESTADPAGNPAGNPATKPDPCMGSLWMIGPLLLVFYFFLLRPQKKQEKQLKAMRSSLKRGDRIVTSGGMHAFVASVEENVVMVRPTPDGPSMVFDATAIGRVLSDEGEGDAKGIGKGGKGR